MPSGSHKGRLPTPRLSALVENSALTTRLFEDQVKAGIDKQNSILADMTAALLKLNKDMLRILVAQNRTLKNHADKVQRLERAVQRQTLASAQVELLHEKLDLLQKCYRILTRQLSPPEENTAAFDAAIAHDTFFESKRSDLMNNGPKY